MNKKSLLTILGIFVGLAALLAQEKINRTFEDVEEIQMNIGSGDVLFTKGSGNTVTVNLEHTFGDEYSPIMELRGSVLVIKEEQKRNSSYRGNAQWKFAIPDDVQIGFNTGSGDVQLENLASVVDLNSGSGSIEIRKSTGDFDLNTGSGSIEFTEVTGTLSVNCGSGNIELTACTAEIRANTGSGSIDVEQVVISGKSSFNSGSGSVKVALSGELKNDLSVNSGSGSAILDFNVNRMEGTLVMEANKRNGKIEAPFEFDSEEEIDQGYNTKIRKTKKFSDKDITIRIGSGSGTAEIKD